MGNKARFLGLFGAIFGVVGLVFVVVGVAQADSFLVRIFTGLGALFVLIGGGVLLMAWRTVSARSWLRKHGEPRWANVEDIVRNYSVEMNGRNPFVVEVSWLERGRIVRTGSDYLWRTPDATLIGEQVRVLVDPQNPDRNLVDLTVRRTLPEA